MKVSWVSNDTHASEPINYDLTIFISMKFVDNKGGRFPLDREKPKIVWLIMIICFINIKY